MRDTRTPVALVAAVAVVALAFAGRAMAERPTVDRASATSGQDHSRSGYGDDLDRAFVTGMVPHHQAAVDMARVEVDKGNDREVKSLARRIIETQEREIAEMSDLAEKKWGFRPGTQREGPMGVLMDMPISMDMSTMAHHLAMASDVDRAFLEMMIPHHAAAISMADEERHHGTDRQLVAMARHMGSDQAREIGQMHDMLHR